jgi:hypothetical protein
MRIIKRARLVAFCVFLLCSSLAHALPDAILAQILQSHHDRGNEGARATARGLGITLREEKDAILVPVIIDRQLQLTADFDARLQQAGGRLDDVSRSYARLLVPLGKLEHFAAVFKGERFRAPYPHREASGAGSIVSESVSLTGADGYQAGNLSGDGIKVAVIDLGFSGLSARISEGELPPDTVTRDFTNTSVESGTKHGTGVAEHVLDMAPGVQLYCIKVNDSVGLQNAADYLADNGIDIANHSVVWVNASYYDGTGTINQIINDSYTRDSVFWTISSGNEARKHWRGLWSDSDGDDTLEFSANDEFLGLTGSASTVQVFLNWNQYGFRNKTDLDLYVYDKNDSLVSSSVQEHGRNDPPAEAVSFSYSSDEAPYKIKVMRDGGSSADGLDITLFSFNHNFDQPVAASSQPDPANAPGAFTVGAVNRTNWLKASPAIRNYSSQGPTTDVPSRNLSRRMVPAVRLTLLPAAHPFPRPPLPALRRYCSMKIQVEAPAI